ncbi:MAG TPA: ABC transporter permease [Magnetospirillaceae bacterium]|nr:ABC transporter permease [Magnetospirillaceae bacterium]
MDRPVISLDRVSRVYRLGDTEVRALDEVSLTVEPGEFVAIMGTSGSGKSTLMNILGCLDQPDGGHYLLEGVDTAALSEPDLARIRGQRIGFVFQSFNLLTRTAAIENVALPLFYAGRTEGSLERAREALSLLGLAERQKNHPNQLSGGQQQRVAIARALINHPAILLADEPTGNVDSHTSAEIMHAITALNREQGLTVVLVTHEPDMAAYADRVVTLKDGRILSDVRTRESARHPLEKPALHRPGRMAEIRSFLGLALLAALRAIGRHKMRAALTMLGVFIGVAALIAMVAVGEGARAAVKNRLASLGTNLLIATPASSRSGGVRGGLGSASSITVADAKAILEEDDAVSDVAWVARQNAQVIYGDENWATGVQGVTPSYLSIRNWAVASGRDFTAEDEHDGAMVCILGQSVVDALFGPDSDPIGATVLVKSVPLTVIGVLAAKGNSGGGQDQDDVILTPFSTSQQRILGVSTPSATVATAAQTSGITITTAGPTSSPSNPFGIQPRLAGFVNAVYIQARSGDVTDQAVDQVTQTLERRHRIKPDGDDDFTVRNLTEIAEVAEQSSRVLEILLAAIASISLLVGGIGIMNILLVSVTERTREIGIRMAIGARRIHVLLQFLVEAVLLSGIGGGAGVLTGIAAAKIISAAAGWPTLLSPAVIVGAFLVSAVIGVFFGYYPARKASLLNPIDALRYE